MNRLRTVVVVFVVALVAGVATPASSDRDWVVFRAMSNDEPVLDLASEEVTVLVDGQPMQIRSLEVVGSSKSRLLIVVDEDHMRRLDQFVQRSVEALLSTLADDDRVAFASARPDGVRVAATSSREAIRSAVRRLTFGTGATPDCATSEDGRPTERGGRPYVYNEDLLTTVSALLRASSPLDVPTLVVFTARWVCFGRQYPYPYGPYNAQYQRLASVAAEVPAFHYVVDLPPLNHPEGREGYHGSGAVSGALGADHITLAYPNDDRMKRIVRDTAAYYRLLIEASEAQRVPQEGTIEIQVSRDGVAIRDAGRLRAVPPSG